MLLGEHDHSLDDKNRLTLPAKLRESLGDRVVVTSGFDGLYFASTRNPTLRSWMFPAVPIGGLLPIALPLVLLTIGRISRSAGATLAAWAVGQAEFIGALVAAAYKAITGRAHPSHGAGADLSHIFHLSETTVAGVCGDHLRALYRPWRLHDHPLVLGFRGRSDHRIGHRGRGGEELFAQSDVNAPILHFFPRTSIFGLNMAVFQAMHRAAARSRTNLELGRKHSVVESRHSHL